MSCLWMHLCLLSAASLLQRSACVSNPGVSLKCNQTNEDTGGRTVTLNCMIFYSVQKCMGTRCLWCNTHSDISCNASSTQYSSKWDKLTYASLTISDVTEEDNYTLYIGTDCGRAQSPAINVKVPPSGTSRPPEKSTSPRVQPIMLGISTTLIVFGLLLLGANKGREIIKRIKKGKTQGDPGNMATDQMI